MSNDTLNLETEIRKLKPVELYTLGQILNVSDAWKKLVATIPKEGTEDIPRFNSETISLIEQAARQQRRNGSDIFLEEWATMGRKRPTVGSILHFLIKAELFRAADYIALDLLKEEAPRRPDDGPAAPVDVSPEAIAKLLEEQRLNDSSSFLCNSTQEESLNVINCPPEECSDLNDCPPEQKDVSTSQWITKEQKLQGKSSWNDSHMRKMQDPVSDLMKFSKSEVQPKSSLKSPREALSDELPVFLVQSDENSIEKESCMLPLVLEDSTNFVSDETTGNSSVFNSQSEDSSSQCEILISKSYVNAVAAIREVNSAELPMCLLKADEGNSKTEVKDYHQVTLKSSELPILILEQE